MKKILLTLGTIAAVVAPIVSVVSCGSSKKTSTNGGATDNSGSQNYGTPIKNVFSGGIKTPNTIAELKKKFPTYYNVVSDDATGETLFNQLKKAQSSHLEEVGSYGDLWETYKTAFLDKYDEKDNTILDIYSEKPGTKDPYEFKPGVDQDKGHHSQEADAYNREHMIPQSIFGKNAQHIHNDAHFIYPTDAVVNGARSNYPYDYVDKASRVFEQGSKLGTGAQGEVAFEPIDAFKGDVARATLYFVMTWKDTKWDLHESVFSPFDGGKMIGGIKQSFLRTYLEWDHKDDVSQFDVDRNNAIAKAEGGIRNPFVDMPKLVDLIWGAQAGSWTKHVEVKTTLKPGTSAAKATIGGQSQHVTHVPTATKSEYNPVDADFAKVNDIDIDLATTKPYVSGLISSKHTQAIKDAWADIKASAKTIDEVVSKAKEAAYPGNTDTRIEANVKAWLGRVINDLKK